jgi:hypothetical protein
VCNVGGIVDADSLKSAIAAPVGDLPPTSNAREDQRRAARRRAASTRPGGIFERITQDLALMTGSSPPWSAGRRWSSAWRPVEQVDNAKQKKILSQVRERGRGHAGRRDEGHPTVSNDCT